MCIIRQANCLTILNKNSYGNTSYEIETNKMKILFIIQGKLAKLKVNFIFHDSIYKEDGSAYGPMTLKNLEIMAKYIEMNGEQSLIDQFLNLEFSKQLSVEFIRNEHWI